MLTLICSGTLYSNWQSTLKQQLPNNSSEHPAYAKLTTLSENICRQQFRDSEEFLWKSFTPSSKYTDKTRNQLPDVEDAPLFVWADKNCNLFLDYWKAITNNVKFLLFYSSPERELGNYLFKHPYDAHTHENVLKAWAVRTREMHAFFMKNRDRCLLVNAQCAESSQGALVKALNQHFDLELKPQNVPFVKTPSVLVEFLATSLLLNNHYISEIYDDVCSSATLISKQEKQILDIEDRNIELIGAFVDEVKANVKLNDKHAELEEELCLYRLQKDQITEELEYYFDKNIEQENLASTMANYLSTDPLLSVARQVRKMQ